MGKLYELLAVEGSLKSQVESALSGIKKLFGEGASKLVGQIRTYKPFDDEGERFPPESSGIATTVDKELDNLRSVFGRYLDACVQKEATNQRATADVVIDGKALFSGLPATALLSLENKLAMLRAVYIRIPANDPTEKWEKDDDLGVWRAAPRITYRTKKVPRVQVLYEATEHHPAQVQPFNEDIQVGQWTTIIFSGMIPMADARAKMERLDGLIAAIKQARQRANDTEVKPVEVGRAIFDYIDGA